MNPGKSSLSRFLYFQRPEWILVLAWILMQSFLFYQHGIHTEIEASKYINEARYLLDNGKVSTPNFWLYSVQIFLIAATMKLHTGFLPVVLIQFFFNALATWYLYKLCRQLGNKTSAFVCVLLFILNSSFQTFNTFLYTESLFYSFTLLLSCYLLRLTTLNFRTALYIFLFLLLICFTRPSGLLFAPAVFLYLFFRFFKGFPVLLKVGIAIVLSFAFLFFLNIALGSGGELDLMLPFREEQIICGVSTLPGFAEIKISQNPNSVQGLLYYIIHNPEQFIRLGWWRTKAFFGLTRSYYSKGHNLYLVLYFYPLYLMMLYGIINWWRKKGPLLLYCMSLIFITWGTVILSCDDWHNRFYLSILPYIYILSLPAIQKLTGKIKPDPAV